MKKQIAAIMSGILLAAAVMTGCGAKGDPETYVKGVLDVAYNQGIDDYVEATGAKKADAEKYVKQSMEAEAKIMAAYFGIEDPSDKVIESFEEVVEELYRGLNYEVKADGKEVNVTLHPVRLTLSNAVKDYMEEFNVKRYVDGDKSCTDEVFAEKVSKLLVEGRVATSYVETIDPVTVTVTVEEKDGQYTVSDEDLVKIDESAILY